VLRSEQYKSADETTDMRERQVSGEMKNLMGRRLYLVLLSAMMVLALGCTARTSGRVHESGTASIKEIEQGDKVAGMVVASVKRWEGNGFESYEVVFSGRLKLSGTFNYFYSEYFSGPDVSFQVDEESQDKLPRILEDSRQGPASFQLRPHPAFGELGSQGTAVIVVDQIELVHREMGKPSSARLVRVVRVH